MSDLTGSPENWFSRIAAHLMSSTWQIVGLRVIGLNMPVLYN